MLGRRAALLGLTLPFFLFRHVPQHLDRPGTPTMASPILRLK